MKEDSDVISWLAQWDSRAGDGNGAHGHRVRIGNTEPPGWEVLIDLGATDMAGDVFGAYTVGRSHEDWLRCEIRDGQFEGACGPGNLIEMLERFRSWVAARGRQGGA